MATIFRTASIWLKAAIVLMTLGIILFFIGFVTTSWVTYDTQGGTAHKGLWQQTSCYDRNDKCSTCNYASLNSYHRAIQAMETLGLIGLICAVATLFLYIMLDSCRRRDFLLAALGFTCAGVAFSIIGYAIFGSDSNTENVHGYGDIDWSMGLACTGTACFGLAGVALIIQLVK